MKKYSKTLFGIILQVFALALAGSYCQAQSGDLVYIDSVISGPGQDVTVRFSVRNIDTLASLSIPITYDTAVLKLKSLSFAGSRVDYIANKLTTPQTITQSNGHFVVAVFRIMEAPIAPGDGYAFTVTFGVSASAVVGTSTKIDSLFYPPGGDLLLVQATTAKSIHPAFRAGKVTVSTRPPVFASVGDQSVLEGDTMKLDVSVVDAGGQQVTLSLITKPTGATLIDNGNGTGQVRWVPDYVGPNSSDMSPFTIGVRATNGAASSDISVHVTVVNRDRAPAIAAASSLQVQAGQPISFSLSATDPDFDAIAWTVAGLPSGATFDHKNPGRVDWTPAITDSNSRTIKFVASDPTGFSDTALVTVNVVRTIIYALYLDTLTADLNTSIDYFVYLDNKLPVSSFRLLFNYDPSVLTLLSVTKVGTRSAGMDVFDVTSNVGDIAGNTRVVGNVNLPGQTTKPALAAANGPIAKLSFRTSGNLAYGGQNLPVRFEFLDAPVNSDNTLADSSGVKITQGQITYRDGWVLMRSLGQIRIGDINLNGLAFEISDIIYFTNYFISPGQYPFNAVQYANSDVNGDGFVATIGDLVSLINVIIGGGHAARVTGQEPSPVELSVGLESNRTVLRSSSQDPVAGLLITLETDAAFDMTQVHALCTDLTVDSKQDGRVVRLLFYDLNGHALSAGDHELIAINGSSRVTVKEVSAASVDGQLMAASVTNRAALPEAFSLSQNYPNPFNPETNIEFALSSPASVTLVVYNVLGERIITLAQGEYPAGEHRVTWRGTDQYGESVASGVYFYRLETPTNTTTRKMMLMK